LLEGCYYEESQLSTGAPDLDPDLSPQPLISRNFSSTRRRSVISHPPVANDGEMLRQHRDSTPCSLPPSPVDLTRVTMRFSLNHAVPIGPAWTRTPPANRRVSALKRRAAIRTPWRLPRLPTLLPDCPRSGSGARAPSATSWTTRAGVWSASSSRRRTTSTVRFAL